MQIVRSPLISRILLVLGLLATAVAIVSSYVRGAVFDSQQFGDHAAEVVRTPAVREALATEFADRVIELEPQALSARPTLISVGESALGGQAAGGVVSRAAAQTQRALLTADEPSLVLDFADLAVVASALASSQGLDLPLRLDPDQLEVTQQISDRAATANLIALGQQVDAVAYASTLLAIALVLLAMALAPERRRALLQLGAGLLAVAIGLAVLAVLARSLLLHQAAPEQREVIRAVVDAYGSGFGRWLLLIGLLGAVLTASAASLVGSVEIGQVPRRAWARLTEVPRAPARRLLRGALLVGTGLLIVRTPQAALTLVATVAGGYLGVLGLMSVLSAFPASADAGGAPERGAADAAGAPGEHRQAPAKPGLSRPRQALTVVLGVVGALAIPVLAAWQLQAAEPVSAAPDAHSTACNGSEVLCGRRLDQVVFASSHNANTTAADGFLNANHGMGMLAQLDVGIRGLLIDTAAGSRNARGVVRTDLTGTTRDVVVDQIGEEGLAAAQRLGGRVAFGPLPEGSDINLYLCHVLCEMGAVDAVESLRGIRDWVAAHPREVLVIFVQDDSPRELTLDALRRSGLSEYAAVVDPAKPLPTLGELIASGKRVVLAAENHPGGEPWWIDGFQLFQETPFGFPTPQALMAADSCRVNRGTATAPMFQLNHWVETYPPRPRNADLASRKVDILERARRCWAERDRVPNLLAVDFVERTGVIEAADELNREVSRRLVEANP